MEHLTVKPRRPDGAPIVYSSEFCSTSSPIDVFKELKRENLVRASDTLRVQSSTIPEMSAGTPLDITNWLPAASKAYHISPDISDYVLVPCATIPSDLPNRNGIGFPLAELVKFNPEAGRLAYKTFKAKPTFYEHRNGDITAAKGVIVDAFLRPLHGYNNGDLYKLVKLLAFDRSKDEELTNRILSGDINTYSMGAFIGGYLCSICDQEIGKCHHINPRNTIDFQVVDGKLAYRKVFDIDGFETSSVESPAWMIATSDKILAL